MNFFAIKTAIALVVLAVSCALILVWNALTGWMAVAACAALVIAVGAAAWAITRSLRRSDRLIEHRSELSTLAFPPSSLRK